MSDTSIILLSEYCDSNPKPKTINHKSKIINQKYADLKVLGTEEVQGILISEYPEINVIREIKKMILYCQQNNKKYKNYLAFARNWLMRCEDKN